MTPSDDEATHTGAAAHERFARARAIFEAALARPAGRAAFVENACQGDAELAGEVRGMLAADAKSDLLLDRPPTPPPSSAPEEGRFPAGTMLAGRYRILGLLGRGGMGEVYRAHDLILNQTVALKFLVSAHVGEAALTRFRNEVRIARQVSHPNVCRVYDLGMVEGYHFLSMEYIDGEDLASLLRRIGRLPPDKAMEFTRKICAGLFAAHERGVLHRDLKPANIMIDGRGQPRITDFGLAGLAAEIPLSDLRSGTPAYMSPEQKAGKDLTTRSDLYSLGLVLHEMFTGKVRESAKSTPTDLVKDLDPAIERVILRCLEEDSKRRPSSALSVSMALPGGDPIAAALAAGETPSPEMVAASQTKEGLKPGAAIACFLALLVCLPPAAFIERRTSVWYRAPFANPPEAMAFAASEVLGRLGHGEPASDRAFGLVCCDDDAYRQIARMSPDRRDAVLASHAPPVAHFWYRQHRATLVPVRQGRVDYNAPANDQPGMIRLRLDGNSRLIGLEVRPGWTEPEAAGSSPLAGEPEPDSARLFREAGLDETRFRPVDPASVPPMAFDVRRSWVGTYGGDRTDKVRVEAAWWQNRPVWFDVIGMRSPEPARPSATAIVTLFLPVVVLVAALLMAWHNVRSGRGDRRGAALVARVGFASALAAQLLRLDYVQNPSMGPALITAVAWPLLGAAALWTAYTAAEPYVRRRAPDSLISMARVQAGRLRDPLVASHVLVGIAVMAASLLLSGLVMRYARGLGDWDLPGYVPVIPISFLPFQSSRMFASQLLIDVGGSIAVSLAILVVSVVLQVVCRRRWIADVVTSMLFGLMGLYAWNGVVGFLNNALYMYFGLVVLLRFGFLALWARTWAYSAATTVPPSFAGWLAGPYLFGLGLPIAVGAWALWVILTTPRPLSIDSATS